jgi:hypothetical protein
MQCLHVMALTVRIQVPVLLLLAAASNQSKQQVRACVRLQASYIPPARVIISSS